MEEVWKDIEGYEGLYQVSSFGNFRSVDRMEECKDSLRKRKGRILKDNVTKLGYNRVTLCKNGVTKTFFRHRLVANAFIPNKENLPFINHKDENKLNNRVENLEWCTAMYNNNYGTRTERNAKSRLNNKRLSKPIAQYDMDWNFIRTYPSAREAWRQTGIGRTCIAKAGAGKSSYAGGFRWKIL